MVSKKNESEHRILIQKSITDWCIRNESIINIVDFNPTCGVHYHLNFHPSLEKIEIKCSCSLSFTLLPGESGNFKVKRLIRIC